MGLESVELVMAWEEEFGISIADEEAASLLTPRMAIDLIASKIHQGSSAKFDRSTTQDEIRGILMQIIKEQLGVRDFSDDDEFIRDLGVD